MQTYFIDYLYLGTGALIGTFLRYWISNLAISLWGSMLWGTLLINWLGSFLFAFLAAGLGSYFQNFTHVRLFFLVGLLGSFTTFSTFSFDILSLFQRKFIGLSLLYLFSSVAGSILLAGLGWYWASKIRYKGMRSFMQALESLF